MTFQPKTIRMIPVMYSYTTYKFKVSYVIDGKTYKGKYEERVWSSSSSYDKKIYL